MTPGTRLGPYEVLALLGAGGMGEVYRARDAKLNREVALKILPAAVANDPDRLARFTREAQTLAALNHPNIGAIYGIEESQSVRALVMELIEGEDLSALVARGPLPLDEVLTIAKQIAEALEAAHDHGIIHRDLKPANIKVRPDGTVKVLDFGLAKALDPTAASSATAMNSPTLTSPAMLTGAGVILGTAAYMSPEQAKGRVLDRRADIWAFGVVLFEMLAGRRPFAGETISETIAAVLKTDPNWQALPVGVTSGLRGLLRRCLDKDPRRRLQAIGDARVQIEDLIAGNSEENNAPVPGMVPRWRRMLPFASIGVLAAALALVLAMGVPWRQPVPPRVTRTTITTPVAAGMTINLTERNLALSHEGTHVFYIGNNATQLFVRALDALEPAAIASGVVLRGPFVSPDGQWVGFGSAAGNTLHKVATTGGPSVRLAGLDGGSRGATWTPNDSIIFATSNQATGLQRVSAAGGTPEILTRPDHAQGEADHLWPEVLPGGRAVLFTITAQAGGLETAQVAVRDLRSGTHRVLLRGGSHAQYVASGHMLYVAAGTLRAIPFDLDRLETYATAVPVLARLATTSTGTGDFAVATDGTLVYIDADLAETERTLVWVDRSGKEEAIAARPGAYLHPRLSPDGTQIALSSRDQENDLWILDLRRTTLERLTSDPGADGFPLWTSTGRIVFSSNRSGQNNLWWQAADGGGAAERLTTSDNPQFPTSLTPDGSAVLFFEGTPTMGRELMQLALGTRRVTPLMPSKFDEHNGVVSPDGRWLAYESNSSGSYEIYVRSFPNIGGGQSLVSTAGGTRPLWARSGRELFYVNATGELLRTPVGTSGVRWNAGTPTKVLDGRYYVSNSASRSYDVSPDGERFLMIKAPETASSAAPLALIVVQHWDEELKRLVPTSR